MKLLRRVKGCLLVTHTPAYARASWVLKTNIEQPPNPFMHWSKRDWEEAMGNYRVYLQDYGMFAEIDMLDVHTIQWLGGDSPWTLHQQRIDTGGEILTTLDRSDCVGKRWTKILPRGMHTALRGITAAMCAQPVDAFGGVATVSYTHLTLPTKA